MAANDRIGNLPERIGPLGRRFAEYWSSLPKTGLVPARTRSRRDSRHPRFPVVR
jgi:hypothetical protein